MSRTARLCLAVAMVGSAHPAMGQDRPAGAEVAAQARDAYGPPPDTEPCSAQQEAAAISGEIVVCARRPSDEHRLRSAGEAEARYAAATMDAGDPRAPDLGPPPCARGSPGCFHFGRVPPRAIVIDFNALPDAPPGSDADRIARGLAPVGNDGAHISAEALGLPPPLNPPAAAAPAAPPADPASRPAANTPR